MSYQDPTPQPQPDLSRTPERRFALQGKFGPAFWTIASLVSLSVNVILIIVLLVLGAYLFDLKKLVQDEVLGGLYNSFVQMDQASIKTQIPINTTVPAKFDVTLNTTVPAKFDLPLNTSTVVTLTQDTSIGNATIYNLQAGPLYIERASANITLPAGTQLPVQLNLTVPVDQQIPINLVVPIDQQIPVNLMVDVDIPLSNTELHEPFSGLRQVVEPFYLGMETLPDSWGEAFRPKP